MDGTCEGAARRNSVLARWREGGFGRGTRLSEKFRGFGSFHRTWFWTSVVLGYRNKQPNTLNQEALGGRVKGRRPCGLLLSRPCRACGHG